MARNFLWKIQRGVRKVFARIRRFWARVSWRMGLGFGAGIVVFSLLSYTALYLYSRNRFNSISEAFAHLLSLEIDRPDYIEEFGEEYFIETGEARRDIFGDYLIPYTLSDELYEKCRMGFCKIMPEVEKAEGQRSEAEEIYEIAGPTILLNGEFEREGEVKFLKVVVGEEMIAVNLRVVVRVFDGDGVMLGAIVS